MMKKTFFLFISFCFAVLQAFAASDSRVPVKWTWEAEINPDNISGNLVLTADIDDGYHIYGMTKSDNGIVATEINPDNSEGIVYQGTMEASEAPKNMVDPIFGPIEYWEGTVTFSQPFLIEDASVITKLSGSVVYMACLESSCTPPETVPFLIELEVAADGTVTATPVEDVSIDDETDIPLTVASSPVSPEFDIYAPVEYHKLSDTSTTGWYLFLMGFLGGLLALLTPCVWPMIPMTVSFFLKKTKSRARSIRDAVIYALSIIIIYVVLGLTISLIFGASALNNLATSAVFNLIFFALLVFFAISFFGAFDIKLPSRWSNKMDNMAEKTTGYLSIFFMAFTLALVSFSCTGPIIGTLLVEAASDQSIAGPALGMAGFAFGLALPFGLFAFFPSLLKEMPKSGGWMNSVKVVLGFIELILSLKFLSVADLAYGWRILDREVFLAIWIVLFVLLGLYLLGKLRFPHDAPKQHTGVFSFFLATISFSFAVYMLPGLWGAPLKSISAFAPPLSTQDFSLYEHEIRKFDDYDEGMKYARDNNLPVMVDFSGYGCVNCRKMEVSVFDDDKVREILSEKYVLIELMVDDRTPLAQPEYVDENGKKKKITTIGEKWSWLQRHKFDINSQPFYVLLDGKGNLINESPREYDENIDEFVAWLNKGLENFEKIKN